MRGLFLVIAAASALLSLAKAQIVDPAPPFTPYSASDTKAIATWDRAARINIPSVNFDKADIADAIKFLNVENKKRDPNHGGIRIRLDLPAAASATTYHRELTILLENTPLSDVLQYIAQQTNLKIWVKGDEITFTTKR